MQYENRVITSFDGTKLNALVKENGARDWLIVTHGVGEHLERHQHLLKLFPQRINIFLYDLRGHGLSEGEKGHIEDFTLYRKDLSSVIDYLRKEFSMKDYLLFGHSMGGLITCDFIQNEDLEKREPRKIILSSPAIGAAGVMGPVVARLPLSLFTWLKPLPNHFHFGGVLDLTKLSHDSRVYENYINDEKVLTKLSLGLYLEILKAIRRVFSRPLRSKCPLAVVVGSEDKLVHPKICQSYFEKQEKSALVKVIEGGYHELHNEIERYKKPYVEFLKQEIIMQKELL